MKAKISAVGITVIISLLVGLTFGILLGSSIIPPIETIVEIEKPIVTEKIVTVEIEKPIITQQIVEIVREVEVYRFIDTDHPVHKWIDPDNHAVVYIYPDGYTGQVMPMYSLVPPVWFEQILQFIIMSNNGVMPPEIINSIPKEWLEAVAPSSGLIRDSGLSN